jgi:hypothetical protein
VMKAGPSRGTGLNSDELGKEGRFSTD